MPIIVVWGFVLPGIYAVLSRKLRDINRNPSLRMRYSFLVLGYNESSTIAMDWDALIMIRKTILVIIISLMPFYNVMFTVLLCLMIMHAWKML